MKGPYYIITDTQEMTLAFLLNLNLTPLVVRKNLRKISYSSFEIGMRFKLRIDENYQNNQQINKRQYKERNLRVS